MQARAAFACQQLLVKDDIDTEAAAQLGQGAVQTAGLDVDLHRVSGLSLGGQEAGQAAAEQGMTYRPVE